MDVTMVAPPAPKVAAPELDPIDDGPSFDEVLGREEAPPEREATKERGERDDAEPRERVSRDDRDDRAGAQSATGTVEARGATESAAAGTKAPGEAAATQGIGIDAQAALTDQGAPAEALPESLTRASLADRLAQALMARGGEGSVEVLAEGELTDSLLLTGATSLTEEGSIDLKGIGKPAAALDAPAPPRPVTLQAATPSGTRAGEAVTTRLPASVDESSVMRQITDGLKLERLGRKQTAEIQLHPAELGKVTVKIHMEAGVARVFLGAENAAVADLMGSTMEQLRNDLMAQGVQVEHFEVSHHGSDGEAEGDGAEGEGDEVADEGDTPTEAAGLRRRHDGRISVTA